MRLLTRSSMTSTGGGLLATKGPLGCLGAGAQCLLTMNKLLAKLLRYLLAPLGHFTLWFPCLQQLHQRGYGAVPPQRFHPSDLAALRGAQKDRRKVTGAAQSPLCRGRGGRTSTEAS
mmetsp:Transcript_27951/g.80564  ORF Transcript_27951/g.80564 Transcript_27951/m.80564 type:complete len:117 (-) Transcript_27951:110-460(-)